MRTIVRAQPLPQQAQPRRQSCSCVCHNWGGSLRIVVDIGSSKNLLVTWRAIPDFRAFPWAVTCAVCEAFMAAVRHSVFASLRRLRARHCAGLPSHLPAAAGLSLVRAMSSTAACGGAGAAGAGSAAATPSVAAVENASAGKPVVEPSPMFDELSETDARAWMASVDTFLVDCDGVMWRGTVPIPGSSDTIDALRAAGKRVVFVVRHASTTVRACKCLTPTSPDQQQHQVSRTVCCSDGEVRRQCHTRRYYEVRPSS